MATYLTSGLLMGLIISASALDGSPSRKKEILVAIKEMQTANYFTFVMLINMVQDKIQSNTTFLMPNDRLLSEVSVLEEEVLEFLSRHSIPSPLLFDDLKHLPTRTMIPTNKPDYTLRVSNNGRKEFYLNEVQLISPNLCVAGSSIRCHGINGVLTITGPEDNRTAPGCSRASTIAAEPSPDTPHSSLPPLGGPSETDSTTTPPPVNKSVSQKSGSPDLLYRGLFTTITSCVIQSLMRLQI